MTRISTVQPKFTLTRLLGVAVLAIGIPVVGQAAPVGQQGSAATGTHDRRQLRAQLKDVDTKISKQRAHNTELQAKVTQMEQQNADQQKQLQHRDDEITALRKKLHAAGVPASGSSTGD